MLWTMSVIVVVLWLLGCSFYIAAGLIPPPNILKPVRECRPAQNRWVP